MNKEAPGNDVGFLVDRARNGDEEAFGELMRMYHQRVYSLIFGMVHNAEDAKDLSQQAWIKVWTKLDSFKGRSGFYTWVYRIAVFASLDFIRSRSRKKETEWLEDVEPERDLDAHVPAGMTDGPDRKLHHSEIREVFERALESLTPEHKAILILRDVDELSYDEIAKVMKCRKGTVMSRIFYARKNIRKSMGELL